MGNYMIQLRVFYDYCPSNMTSSLRIRQKIKAQGERIYSDPYSPYDQDEQSWEKSKEERIFKKSRLTYHQK